ncbi:hypothetical protein [Candidatus Orientia mediorientalis]|nr:hypothetical protein [Candidatus Orientia mediorientalis]
MGRKKISNHMKFIKNICITAILILLNPAIAVEQQQIIQQDEFKIVFF